MCAAQSQLTKEEVARWQKTAMEIQSPVMKIYFSLPLSPSLCFKHFRDLYKDIHVFHLETGEQETFTQHE